MRYLLAILLFVVVGYSLMLVLVNNNQVEVNLLFSQVPQMSLGLLLIISIVLGVIAGLLMGLILFRVLQMKLENQRLSKELKQTHKKDGGKTISYINQLSRGAYWLGRTYEKIGKKEVKEIMKK